MLVKNIAWIFSSEFINRLSRLITAVVLARCFSHADYGVAAMALATNEIIRVLTQNGIGLQIVKSSEASLEAVCEKVYRVNWVLCGSLVLIQIAVSFFMAKQFGDERLVYLISLLSVSYLVYPFAMVHVFLAQRESNLKLIAINSAAVISLDNLLTALFAMLDFGVISVVIPKLLVAPLWVYLFRKNIVWKSCTIEKKVDVNLFGFSRDVLVYEVLKCVRQNIDLFIVGLWFGLAEAGIYAFAKNAGVGISLALVSAFNSAVFPHLCQYRQSLAGIKSAYLRSAKIALFVLVPLFLLQAILAPFYVPYVFGEQWESAIPILVLLCLSAIPRCFIELNTQLLRTMDATTRDLYFSAYFTTVFIGTVLFCSFISLQVIAYGILAVTIGGAVIWCATNYIYFLRNTNYLDNAHRV